MNFVAVSGYYKNSLAVTNLMTLVSLIKQMYDITSKSYIIL